MVDILIFWVSVRGLIVNGLVKAGVEKRFEYMKTAFLATAINRGTMPQVETVRGIDNVGVVAAR
jgi:hypothetical protein